jgi:hypothetical protein
MRRSRTTLGWAFLLLLSLAGQASAETPDEAIRATIARWYEELAKRDDGRPYALAAPGMIDASPYYDYVDTGSRALGPRIYTSLASRALKFDYRIRSIRSDASFARVNVHERGYFYAAASQVTYETAADTTFVLERGVEDGRWRILVHETGSIGFAPSQATDPMPDLRELFYTSIGKDRDPAKDAAEADNF